MDMAIGIFFSFIAFIMFFFGLFEERDQHEGMSDEEQEKSDNLVIIFMVGAVIFFFIAGVFMMYITETYYSPITDTYEEILMTSYVPLGWLYGGLSAVSGILLTWKVFQVLGAGWKQEG